MCLLCSGLRDYCKEERQSNGGTNGKSASKRAKGPRRSVLLPTSTPLVGENNLRLTYWRLLQLWDARKIQSHSCSKRKLRRIKHSANLLRWQCLSWVFLLQCVAACMLALPSVELLPLWVFFYCIFLYYNKSQIHVYPTFVAWNLTCHCHLLNNSSLNATPCLCPEAGALKVIQAWLHTQLGQITHAGAPSKPILSDKSLAAVSAILKANKSW